METLQERLISKRAKEAAATVKTAAPAVASRQPLEIDAEGVTKLASALEVLAANGVGTKLLKTAAVVMRQLSKEPAFLVDELAGAMHTESASKLAGELVGRGVCTEKELEEVMAKLLKIGSLGSVRQALEIVQPKPPLAIGKAEKSASSADPSEKKLMDDPACAFLITGQKP